MKEKDTVIPSKITYINTEQIMGLWLRRVYYIRTSEINKELKRIFEEELKTSSKNISTHCLRHSYGTRCVEAGMTAVVLQRLMGHKDVTVTLNTYTSVFNKFKKDELEKVNNYLTNNQLNFINSAK